LVDSVTVLGFAAAAAPGADAGVAIGFLIGKRESQTSLILRHFKRIAIGRRRVAERMMCGNPPGVAI
jgi:hypothetical protein